MKTFDKKSLPYRALKNHSRLFQKDSRKLSNNRFYSKTFRQTLKPQEIVDKTLQFSDELRYYYDFYQLLLFHFQEKRTEVFFEIIEDNMEIVTPTFKKVFVTFRKLKPYIENPSSSTILTPSSRLPTNSSRISNDQPSAFAILRTLDLKSSSL